MRIHALGHSAFLVELENADRQTVRILGDPWLTDHVIGDVMGRKPRVAIDWAHLPPIDAIYLSHSHTDHLDPYSLVMLWQKLPRPPAFLLPHSLAYLEPLLAEFLPGAKTHILVQEEWSEFRGLQLTGLFNVREQATNEDDVMMLLARGPRELFLAQADAVFPYEDPDAREQLSALLLSDDDIDTIGILAIENELEVLMASINAADRAERDAARAECTQSMTERIEAMYEPYDDLELDLWHDGRVVRLLGGQGICFPQTLGSAWNGLLFPHPLDEVARLERSVAESHGYQHEVVGLEPGRTYELTDGSLTQVTRCPFLEVRDPPEAFAFDATVECQADFPLAPLHDDERDTAQQRARIEEILRSRFLPWLIGHRDPPIEHLLSTCGGEYRVRVRYGTSEHHQSRDWVISFERLEFTESLARGESQEEYWANDLEDYLDGRCDDFSTFCRTPLAPSHLLWDCLGMPFLNDDLVARKLRFHFERAARGESVDDWVLGFYRDWMTPPERCTRRV